MPTGLLQNTKLEYELQTEKLQRLERELQEISSAGNKDDKEVSEQSVHLVTRHTCDLSLASFADPWLMCR